jgi:hypothetical protein
MVMPFGVKNGPPTFRRVINKAFKKILRPIHADILDDFIVYSDMESNLMKLTFCFLKCKDT